MHRNPDIVSTKQERIATLAKQHRVCDGVLLRLIGKWLNAGVMESGQISYPEEGSPQGGVISPMVRFNKPDDRKGSGGPAGNGKPESFDLLGFTHYWARSLRGNWVVKRKTSDSRLTRAVRAIEQWCRANRHEPLAEQPQTLSQKIHGHSAYYGITGNSQCLSAFRLWVVRAWRKWLSRRNRERGMAWDRFNQLLDRYPLPAAAAIHSTYRRAASP